MKETHRFTDFVDLSSTKKVTESAHTLREGPGAGYTVSLTDLSIQSGTIKVVESINEGVSFTADIAMKDDVGFRAEGYDWSVDSTDSDDINVAGTKVNGGRIAGYVERVQYIYNPDTGGKDVELDDDELNACIETTLKSFDVSAMVGGGSLHSTLGETFTLENNGNDILSGGGDVYGYVTVVKVEVESPEIAYSVENAFESRYESEMNEVDGDNEESPTDSIANNYFDNVEADIMNSLGGDGDMMLESKEPEQKEKMTEAVDGGWEVRDTEAQEAYEFACEYFGEEELNKQIVQSLGMEDLASSLAFIFRMNDFREWEDRNNEEDEDYTDEFLNEQESDLM